MRPVVDGQNIALLRNSTLKSWFNFFARRIWTAFDPSRPGHDGENQQGEDDDLGFDRGLVQT